MKNDKVKKWLCLILIFGGFFILRNFIPSGLDQAGWDGFLVLFVAVLLWLTEAVPMAVTAVFVLFFGAWVGFEKEANILANFASTGPFFLLAAMVIGQIFTKVGLGRRISLYVLPMFGNKAKAVLLAVMMGTCVVSMFLADIPTALVFFGLCAPILEQNGCEPGKSKFGKAIMLGIPVGAAIGGIGTPAGSGMNAVTMSLLKNICGVEISFGQWSLVGVPVALVSIVLAWLILCWLCKPEIDIVKGLDSLKEDRKNVGPLKGDELKFTIVFAIMVVLWFIPKQTGIDMYMTAWGGIFIMSLPGMNLVNFLSKVAGMGLVVLLLVINVMMAVGHYPMPQGVSLAGLCLPVVGALAVNLGLNPIVVCLPVCMSTSMLLLVPIDPTCFTTYSGGYWKIKDMMSSGILITIGYILVSSLWTAVIAATGALG